MTSYGHNIEDAAQWGTCVCVHRTL